MNNHTDLLNLLAEKFNLQSYLEIGVQTPTNNFDKIICANKRGVDPAVYNHYLIYNGTSDHFFEVNMLDSDDFDFDLIFIDGLHHYEQVKRDFHNALSVLTTNGFIVIHDTLPEQEIHSIVPRQSKVWTGDVYKLVFQLPAYPQVQFCTVDFDFGCTIVWCDEGKITQSVKHEIDFAYYEANKRKMNLVSPKAFETLFSNDKQPFPISFLL
jgi:hypothetical protein